MKRIILLFNGLLLMISAALTQNVGIGITTPQSQLHIGAISNNELIIGRDKNAGGYTAMFMGTSSISNGYGYIQAVRTAGSSWGNLILNPFSGNVGIGMNNPLVKLDVKGSINTDSVYRIGNSIVLAIPGNSNLFAGEDAGKVNTTGNNNTGIGYQALYSNSTGFGNTANGQAALFSNSTGNRNTANGQQALFLNTGNSNTAIGYQALWSNSSGNNNAALGDQALYSNTFGFENTAIGYEALLLNSVGSSNTANGYRALRANTTGDNNTAMGIDAILVNTTGINNTAIGYRALHINTTGSQNTAIGNNANTSSEALINATAIGSNTTVNASNKIRLGNSSVTVIEGNVAYTFPSDGRFKTNVTETVKGLDFIMKLHPVVYNFQAKKMDEFISGKPATDARFASLNYTDAENMRQSGFIAQEVEQAAKTVGYDFNGVHVPKNEKEIYSLAYSQFVVPLVKAVQEQQQIIEALKKRIEILEKKKQ